MNKKPIYERTKEIIEKREKNLNVLKNKESKKTFFYTPFNSKTNFQTTPIYSLIFDFHLSMIDFHYLIY